MAQQLQQKGEKPQQTRSTAATELSAMKVENAQLKGEAWSMTAERRQLVTEKVLNKYLFN